MSTVDDVWRRKSDEQLASAVASLSEWRGDVPLARAYWGFAVLGGLGFRLIVKMTLGFPIINVVLSLLYAGYAVLILVSIWRSAVRYTGDTKWRYLARAYVVLNVLALVAVILMR